MNKSYWDIYKGGNVCILCDDNDDPSVGQYLNLDNKQVCSECREERLTFDNYTGRHFDELIKPNEDGKYVFTQEELGFLLEEFSLHTMRMSWNIDRLMYACSRVNEKFWHFLQGVVGRDR